MRRSPMVIIAWRCNGWTEYLKLELRKRYRASAAITCAEVYVGTALVRVLTHFGGERSRHCWLVVRFDPESLYLLCWWMDTRRIDWSGLNLAMVDVRWSQIESVVEAVRSLPRWPALWLPPRDGSDRGRLERAGI